MIFRRMKSLKEIGQIEKQFKEDMEKTELEKGDRPAMLLAALLVLVPATLIVIAVLVLVPMLFFRLL